jgi:hypothetical protein
MVSEDGRHTSTLWRIDDYASDAVVLLLASVKTIQALHLYTKREVIKYNVGNHAVMFVLLVFLQLHAYAMNATALRWRDRALFSFITFLWFSSFQCSTMIANKCNMLLETVRIMLLVARKDVEHPRCTNSECNEHTYGMWRMMLRKFNVEQLICIVQKSMIKLDCIFVSSLLISRSNAGLCGYQETMLGFIKSMWATHARDKCCEPVDVDPAKEVVHQLWDDVKGVSDQGVTLMMPFLQLFGVVEGNGLSPFVTNIEKPLDLQKLVVQYFATKSRVVSTTNMSAHHGNGEILGILATHIRDIQGTESITDTLVLGDDNRAIVTITTDVPITTEGGVQDCGDNKNENEISFDSLSLKGKMALDYLLMLLQTTQVEGVGHTALKLIRMLQLGKLDKGALSTSGDAKYKTLIGRWFSAKKTSTEMVIGNTNGSKLVDGSVYIRQDTIITLDAVNQDKAVSVEYYCVLGLYNKHYNNLYMEVADEVLWLD